MATRWAKALSGGNGRSYHEARVGVWLDTRQQSYEPQKKGSKAKLRRRKEGPGRLPNDKLAALVTPADVERFITARRKEDGVGDSTIRKEITALSSCSLWAIEMGLVYANPVRSSLVSGIRPSEPPPADGPDSYLTTAEETALLAAAPAWLAPVIRFCVLTGADRGPALALTWRAVDERAGVVKVERSKTGTVRHVPILTRSEITLAAGGKDVLGDLLSLDELLADARKVRAAGVDRVFLNASGGPIHPENAKRAMTRAYATAGIRKPLPWILLRHTYGSRLASAGVPQADIARLMGPKSASTSARYMHLSPAHLRRQALQGMAHAEVQEAEGTAEAQRPREAPRKMAAESA